MAFEQRRDVVGELFHLAVRFFLVERQQGTSLMSCQEATGEVSEQLTQPRVRCRQRVRWTAINVTNKRCTIPRCILRVPPTFAGQDRVDREGRILAHAPGVTHLAERKEESYRQLISSVAGIGYSAVKSSPSIRSLLSEKMKDYRLK